MPSASAVPRLPYPPRHETRPGSPPRPCHCRRAAARSRAEAISWRTYPTAGTPAPGTTANAPAGRASPTRTRPGRPTDSACAGRSPADAAEPVSAGSTRDHRVVYSPASRRASANRRWSGLRQPAWAGRTAAGRSSVPATGPAIGPAIGPREADSSHPPGPAPRRSPSTGPHARIRWCRRAARVRRRRSCRPRPGAPCPSRCRWRQLPLSRRPACRSAKRRRLPYRRTRYRRSRREPACRLLAPCLPGRCHEVARPGVLVVDEVVVGSSRSHHGGRASSRAIWPVRAPVQAVLPLIQTLTRLSPDATPI